MSIYSRYLVHDCRGGNLVYHMSNCSISKNYHLYPYYNLTLNKIWRLWLILYLIRSLTLTVNHNTLPYPMYLPSFNTGRLTSSIALGIIMVYIKMRYLQLMLEYKVSQYCILIVLHMGHGTRRMAWSYREYLLSNI